MSEQIFISYRRKGGDVTAKLICEALKNRGYTVFYDFDSLRGGYFDERIYKAIEECNDFVLVLPPHSLDRCVNENDWVRLEIRHALKCGKNIIPVRLPGFSFPKNLPNDIATVSRFNGIDFVMGYFDLAVIPTIIDRLTSFARQTNNCLDFILNDDGNSYCVKKGTCTDTDITIPSFHNNKPVTKIGDQAFKNCSLIKSIHIPSAITIIGDEAFEHCTALESIAIPNNVTYIGDGAFLGCSSLASIEIPNQIQIIGNRVFFSCVSLSKITIPFSVKEIGNNAFTHCRKITSITLPNGITSIGLYAFGGCDSLKKLNIPESVSTITYSAFAGCNINIHFNGTINQWKQAVIDINKFNSIIRIHCTDGDFSP